MTLMPADFPWTEADAMYPLLVGRAAELRAYRPLRRSNRLLVERHRCQRGEVGRSLPNQILLLLTTQGKLRCLLHGSVSVSGDHR